VSLFSVLNIADSALSAAQISVQTTSNNIANVDTPGYSREEAVLAEAPPATSTVGLMGDGVTVTNIMSYFDQNLANDINSTNSDLQEQTVYGQYLNSIQSILEEQNSQLSTTMTNFFNDWQALSTDPTSTADKQAVASDGQTLCTAINGVYNSLTEQQTEANSSVNTEIGTINTITTQIASLNQLIADSQQGDGEANAYVDQRNQLLNTLSGDMNISSFTNNNNQLTVLTAGGKSLVDGSTSWTLTEVPDPTTGFTRIGWKDQEGNVTDITDEIEGGSLGGLITSRDQTLPGYMSSLNNLAKSLIENVNYFEGLGNDNAGISFFQPASGNYAQTMSLSDQIAQNAQNITATSTTENPTGNDVALKIASLAGETLLGGNAMTGAAFPSDTALLGISGSLLINGTSVAVAPTDTLQDIAQNINGATSQTGVTATVASSSAGYRLVLNAADSGDLVSVVNGDLDPSSSTFLQTLTTTDMADPGTTGVGLSGSFVLDGQTITVTPDETLEDIAQSINGNTGVTSVFARVITNGSGYELALKSGEGYTPSPAIPALIAASPTDTGLVAGNTTLNLPGTAITITPADSLNSIEAAVNGLKATTGVSASIEDVDGQYELELQQAGDITPSAGFETTLTSQNLASTDDAIGVAGTLNLGSGVTITVTATETMEQVADAINADQGTTGICAAITGSDAAGYELTLTSAQNLLPVSGNATHTLGLAGATFTGYQAGVNAQVGQQTKTATNMTDYYQSAVTSLQGQQASVSGVSIDEEMTNLIKFQNAYQAAAQLYTVTDDMLQTLLGAVGATVS
jgi:flagellar hook-associated protein 1 FlgK